MERYELFWFIFSQDFRKIAFLLHYFSSFLVCFSINFEVSRSRHIPSSLLFYWMCNLVLLNCLSINLIKILKNTITVEKNSRKQKELVYINPFFFAKKIQGKVLTGYLTHLGVYLLLSSSAAISYYTWMY